MIVSLRLEEGRGAGDRGEGRGQCSQLEGRMTTGWPREGGEGRGGEERDRTRGRRK